MLRVKAMAMGNGTDQVDRVGTLPQAERRDFSGVGYDEAMRRARAIVPVLRERVQKGEDARVLLRGAGPLHPRPPGGHHVRR